MVKVNAPEVLERELQAEYVMPGLLNLRGPTRGNFFAHLRRYYPELQAEYTRLFGRRSEYTKAYRKALYNTIYRLVGKYGRRTRPCARPAGKRAEEQLTLGFE